MFLSLVFFGGVIAVVFAGAAITGSIMNVLATQFDELMPDRMVDLANFIEIPKL